MRFSASLSSVAVVLALTSSVPAWSAQDVAPAPSDEVTTVEEVVVTARRSGAPVWSVEGPRGTLIVVGDLRRVPRGVRWSPEALDEAVSRADRVLTPQAARIGVGDMAAVLWRSRSALRLPEGDTLDDHVPAATLRRVEALSASLPRDWRARHPLRVADDLVESVGADSDGGMTATRAIERAARRHKKPARAVRVYEGRPIADDLLNSPPARHAPCLAAAIAVAEAGRGGAEARARDWIAGRVPEAAASPLSRLDADCWPNSGSSVDASLRRDWAEAFGRALNEPGVTVAVAPLKRLAGDGGLLADLEARGLDVRGLAFR